MSNRKGFTLIELLIVVAIILIVAVIGINYLGSGSINSFRTVPDDVFLQTMLRENVEHAINKGYKYGGCSGGDTVNTEFYGFKNSVPVHGIICGTRMGGDWGSKAYTVRYFAQ